MVSAGADEPTHVSVLAVTAVLFCLVLMLTSVLFVLSDGSSADGSGDIGTIHWEQTGNTLTFTGTGAMPDYTNVQMDRPWEKDPVQTVVIGSGITSIGQYDFNGHTNLTSVTIGDDVAMIDAGAFNNCQQISSLHFPESVQVIKEYAFARCFGLTEVYFSNLTTLQEYSFDSIDFYDQNQNPLPKTTDALSGKKFVRNEFNNLTDNGWRIIFKTNGGSLIPESTLPNMGQVARPADPVKEGYLFKDWYKNSACTVLYDFYAEFVTSMVILYAGWDEAVTVTFDQNTGTGTMASQVMVKNASTSLSPCTFTKENYHFTGWNTAPDGSGTPYSDGGSVSLSGNVTLYAVWEINTYAVRFVSEGSVHTVYNLSIGQSIPVPTDPSKDSDSKYEYPFSHWGGYTANMTLTTAGATFDAVFDKMIKMNKDGSSITLIDSDQSKMEFTSDRIEMIVTMANTDSELTMTINLENCIVHFDNAALRSLKIADAELSVSKLTYDDLTPAQRKVIGNHTAYDMSFGDNTDFKGGKVSFSVQYYIEEGKTVDDLYVGYVSDGKVTEEIECDYEDGRLSFSTGHLSIYTFLYKEAKKTGFLSDLDFGSFLTIGIILAIALSGIILFVLKKLK